LFILLVWSPSSFAQQDSIIILDDIEIISYYSKDLSNPNFIYDQLRATSAGITTQAHQYLEHFTHANIKSYGPNGLATISLDGLNPQHTQVFWNGIPVNTSTIGITDIGQYPFSSDLAIDILKSADSYQFTGSQLGGAVLLENKLRANSGIATTFQNGSFNKWSADVDGYYAFDHPSELKLGINLGYLTIQNDYAYQDYTTFPIETRTLKNAAYQKLYIQPSAEWFVNNRYYFKVNALYNSNDRDLTASVVSPNNRAHQKDQIVRLSTSWRTIFQNRENNFVLGYAYDYLNYKEYSGEQLNLASQYKVHKIVFNETISVLRLQHDIKFGANFSGDIAKSDDLKDVQLIQGGLFVVYKYHFDHNNWHIEAAARNDFHTISKFGLSGNIAVLGQPWKKVPVKFKLSALRNNKFPTINDLYFEPAGNPNLDQEQSWQVNVELYSEKHYRLKNYQEIKLQSSAEGYSIWLKDMIVWVPTNKIYWSPINLTQVHSKGLKLKNTLFYQHGVKNISVLFNQLYHFSPSTNEANAADSGPLFPNDLTIGKQLPYIPKHQLKLNLFADYKGFFVNLHTHYVSRRFITGSNSYYLQNYWLMDSGIGYRYLPKGTQHQLRMEFTLKNVLNNQYYQEVAHIPMPGRHYQITIKYAFQK
jgi:iron complex outermembrane receptor protein